MVGTLPPLLQSHPSASSTTTPSASAAAGAAPVTATTAVAATPAEEEAFKRNTDCVYFLASPLTCKKGSECEYRHSDVARVNPRDCWYWLHGNCLNPKCAFRHPPLDGLMGTQMPNPMGTSQPPSQPAVTPAAPVSYASGKQGVPCVFFQKGNCLKGDWCPFLHAPASANNKVVQSQSVVPAATETPPFKKTFGGLEKCTQEKKTTQRSVPKSAELNPQAKTVAMVEAAPAKKAINNNKNNNSKSVPASGVNNELHGYRPVDIRPANDGNRVTWPSRDQQPLEVSAHSITVNIKDPEEVSREPSPGFDVLVDNELGDSDYYHSEDHFGITRDHEGMNEYYDGHSGDYSPLIDADQDVFRDSRGYDSYGLLQGQYGLEQRRSSSERMSGGVPYSERRQYGRADSPDQVDESDLRHHLSKHKRVNGLRSIINHDYPRQRSEERGHQASRRDPRHDRDRQGSSLSSRLQGRIKIPVTSSLPTEGSDVHHYRETERGREHNVLSPGRSQVPSRLRDRIKGKVQEDRNNDGRNNRGLRMRTDIISDDNNDFAAPKSLAELKRRRNVDGGDQQSMGKRKYSNSDYQQQTGDLSFEGPKPLEEILKQKRGSETAAFGSTMTSHLTEDHNQNTRDEGSKQGVDFCESRNDSNLSNHSENKEYKLTSGVRIGSERAQSGSSRSLSHNMNEADVEEGMLIDDGAENREPEAYDHGGDEDSDYGHGDGDNYNLDEGENGDAEEEYIDDEDGDDFAKKMGVMY